MNRVALEGWLVSGLGLVKACSSMLFVSVSLARSMVGEEGVVASRV